MHDARHFYVSLALMVLALLFALSGLTAWTALLLVLLICWSVWVQFATDNIRARKGRKATPTGKPRVR
ncbi:hypothetical protein [Corynebacterium sp. TAE3-ERU16]|uniref:hypothetical protein n=1 Tax=Corynebacterium sp. TAE3-ERU16 TaxID=2849493 RepID=UPI001C43C086|nr:hypothetical protein [Corynebacterium sp. TAE3-ERU16]MBV7292212.1 hypothetical protein [Corynebacterium sp. TAE3-ERU16]